MPASCTLVFIPLVYLLFTSGSCNQRNVSRLVPDPAEFNIQLPFKTDRKGILIATQWGAAKTVVNLYLDNHSPTWASNNIITSNKSIKKSNDFLFRTTTADGKTIAGDVYICDSIGLGGVAFRQVPIYNISNETNAHAADGAIGENIMTEGIWKIDFLHRVISFASTADSIEGLKEAEQLPASFTSSGIEITVDCSNHIQKQFELDLGYNGSFILPAKEFAAIAAGNKKMYIDSMRFATPASAVNTETTSVIDSIRIGHHSFTVSLCTNPLVKERLVGLRFFRQFEFIIIDYPGKKCYISRQQNKLPEMK